MKTINLPKGISQTWRLDNIRLILTNMPVAHGNTILTLVPDGTIYIPEDKRTS